MTGQLVAEGSYTALLTSIFRESARLLRSDGHLVFSYANRDPRAWIQLFDALQSAGLRAAGCAVVHSENETDQAKRGVRACTLDLLLDLVPVSARPLVQHQPPPPPTADPEREFLGLVASYALQIGALRPGWHADLLEEAASAEFLRPATQRAGASPSTVRCRAVAQG